MNMWIHLEAKTTVVTLLNKPSNWVQMLGSFKIKVKSYFRVLWFGLLGKEDVSNLMLFLFPVKSARQMLHWCTLVM